MSNKQLINDLIKLHTENVALIGKTAEHFSTHGEESVLLCMYMENKPFFAGDFKEKTGLTSGRIATILKQLESKSLIIRNQDKFDKRKILVELTDNGKEIIKSKLERTIDSHRNLLEYLGESDSAEFIRILKRVLSYVSEHEKDFT